MKEKSKFEKVRLEKDSEILKWGLGISWLTVWILIIPISLIAIIVTIYRLAIRKSKLTKYGIVLSPFLILPILNIGMGIMDYSNGNAKIKSIGYPVAEFANINDEYRVEYYSVGCTFTGTEYLTSFRYNQTIKFLIKKFGFQKHSYFGKVPTEKEGNMKSKYFGRIDINEFQENYESKIELNGNKIQIDMWFEEKTINESAIRDADHFLENLPRFFEISIAKLDSDFVSGQEVKEYLEHHLEEFNDLEQSKLGLNPKNDLSQKINELYKKLQLKRIGIYPTSTFGSEFAIFDFTISEEMTDYLVVVKMDKEGQISVLTTES